MQKIKSAASLLVIVSMFMGNALPAFAQFLEAEPVVESIAEVEGEEPEVQTTVEIAPENTIETSVETTTETVTEIVAGDTTAPAISGVADLSLGINEVTIV
ncbi:MAG: hypothetical protein Q7K26_05405 [bacterium]|nr:hypothetical protein [bacterium]